MATADDIASLRLLIAEPDETTYTDDTLGVRLDASATADHLAYNIWTEKAAAYAALVDKSEGGSSRANGALMDKALKMVALFEKRIAGAPETPSVTAGATVVEKLRR